MSSRGSAENETTPIVRCVDVRKDFDTSAGVLSVLGGVNFEVARGESVAVAGESGSGKSTLLSLIAGLDIPTAGTLEVDGVEPARASEAELADFRARKVGIVFQHFHLMKSLTAIENVRLPLELRGDKDAEDRAKEALTAVGLDPRSDHFPAQLSGGERQRVALARALVPRPPLLLADEPTGNLDEKTGAGIIDLMFELAADRGMSLVLVTHSRELAARCERAVRLRDGLIADSGPAEAAERTDLFRAC